MRCIVNSLLCCGLVLGLFSCRASFKDVQKQNLVSSGDDLGAKDGSDAVPNDFPILENTKELPPEDSESYDCDGTVVIHEKGKDKNRDGVLQPTEVTDIKTECRPKGATPPTGKEPTPPTGKDPVPPPPPPKCPNQSDSKGKCDDDAGQNNPTQSGK